MRTGIVTTLTLILLCPLLWYSYMAVGNNLDSDISRDELRASLVSGIDWLEENKSAVMKDYNSALWWMLLNASEITDEPRLQAFYAEYQRTELDWRRNGYWTGFTDPGFRMDLPDSDRIREDHKHDILDYQIFFLYGLYCDPELEAEPVIQQQLQSDYCPSALRAPACVTHQMMTVRLLQERGCGSHEELAESLLDKIDANLFWEFRAGDSYIQRVLMLVESERSVDSGWIRAILDAQNDDGGWDDIHPLFTLGSWHVGLSSRWPTLRPPRSNFHATAQGVWLMVLLLHQTAEPDVEFERQSRHISDMVTDDMPG